MAFLSWKHLAIQIIYHIENGHQIYLKQSTQPPKKNMVIHRKNYPRLPSAAEKNHWATGPMCFTALQIASKDIAATCKTA